jgi:hypothetical protein
MMPTASWSLTRLSRTRFRRPPLMTIPAAKPPEARGAPRSWLSATSLPVIVMPVCGASRSLVSELTWIPTRLRRAMLSRTTTPPPALVNSSPTWLSAVSLSVTSAWQSLQRPT